MIRILDSDDYFPPASTCYHSIFLLDFQNPPQRKHNRNVYPKRKEKTSAFVTRYTVPARFNGRATNATQPIVQQFPSVRAIAATATVRKAVHRLHERRGITHRARNVGDSPLYRLARTSQSTNVYGRFAR